MSVKSGLLTGFSAIDFLCFSRRSKREFWFRTSQVCDMSTESNCADWQCLSFELCCHKSCVAKSVISPEPNVSTPTLMHSTGLVQKTTQSECNSSWQLKCTCTCNNAVSKQPDELELFNRSWFRAENACSLKKSMISHSSAHKCFTQCCNCSNHPHLQQCSVQILGF